MGYVRGARTIGIRLMHGGNDLFACAASLSCRLKTAKINSARSRCESNDSGSRGQRLGYGTRMSLD
jgi:hypothetical protein